MTISLTLRPAVIMTPALSMFVILATGRFSLFRCLGVAGFLLLLLLRLQEPFCCEVAQLGDQLCEFVVGFVYVTDFAKKFASC